MTADYACLKCGHRFAIALTEAERLSSLDPDRTDACPACGQQVGTGPVGGTRCGGTFELTFPHWHVHCDLASGACPACGARVQSLCVC